MIPINFKYAQKNLQPSGKEYSENVESVLPLPVWSDGEQCLSCWKMSWRERLSALIYGKAWLAILSGETQPPAYVVVNKEYLQGE